MVFCEKCKACVGKHHKHKIWKRELHYEQICNINLHQCFMPMIKTLEAGQGYTINDLGCMQESRTHAPNYVSAMELGPGASWDAEEGAKRERSEWEWEFKEDTCLIDLIQLFTDTKFQSYTFLAGNAKGYGGYFIAS